MKLLIKSNQQLDWIRLDSIRFEWIFSVIQLKYQWTNNKRFNNHLITNIWQQSIAWIDEAVNQIQLTAPLDWIRLDSNIIELITNTSMIS